jgi:hypothetical protein
VTVAPLARRLADLGASPEAIAVAVEAVTLASTCVHGQSKDASTDIRKERDKLRKRAERKALKLQREKEVAQANDGAAIITPASKDASTDSLIAPTFLPSLSLNLEGSIEEGSKQESKRTERVRARGQRMVAGALLTDEFRQAAIDLGATPASVPAMWDEFVDYWVGVPGQRGVKLDWLATWRNDVRRKISRGNGNGRGQQQSLSDRARDLAEQARSAERARGLI